METKAPSGSIGKSLLKSCGGMVGILAGGLILFGIFRYWLGPLLTATTTCFAIDQCLYSVSVGDSSVQRVRFSPNGESLAVIGDNKYLVDADNGDRLASFGSDAVADLVFSQDDRYFAYKRKGDLVIRSMDGEEFSVFPFEGRCTVFGSDCLGFVPEINGIAIADPDGFRLYFLDGEPITLFPTLGAVQGISVSPDGQTVAVALEGGGIWLHPMDDLSNEFQLGGHDGDVELMIFSGNSDKLVTVGREDEQTRVWDIKSGDLLYVLPSIGSPTDMSVDETGNYVAISEDSGLITIWDLAAGEVVFDWAFDRSVRTISLSPDGTKLAIGLAREVTMIDDRVYLNRRPGQVGGRTGPSYSVQGESVSAGSALILETGLNDS